MVSRCQCKTACMRNSCRCKKRGTICTSKCHNGSECQNQAGLVAKLIQGSSSKRAGRPEKHKVKNQVYKFACKTAQISKVLTLVSSLCMPFVQIWILALDLDLFDKNVITNGGLLCDKHMNRARKLLSQQFPAVRGMQNQTGDFVPIIDSCTLQTILYMSNLSVICIAQY